MGSAYHFIGVGGIGMSALAYILASEGHAVSGSDMSANACTERLTDLGVQCFIGHAEAHIQGEPEIVYSSAILASNPEMQAALAKGLTIRHRSDILAQLLNPRAGIGVAGTHGKTTTSSMIAYLLVKAGLDPTVIIGGEMDAWQGNARAGAGEYLVAEVDESDGSLVKLYPKIGVITNIELDHPDYYASLAEVVTVFQRYAAQSDQVVACLDCPNVSSQISVNVGYSLLDHPRARYTVSDVVYGSLGTTAMVLEAGQVLGELKLLVLGKHNLENALAAIATGRLLGIEFGVIARALATFTGAKRRFEVKGCVDGVCFIDDYAHHPSEIAVTLAAAHLHNRRVVAVFQPHRYSRMLSLFHEFAEALVAADHVVVVPTYSAGEAAPLEQEFSAAQLAIAIAECGGQAEYEAYLSHLPLRLISLIKPSDIVLFLGAGNLNQTIPATMQAYRERHWGVVQS